MNIGKLLARQAVRSTARAVVRRTPVAPVLVVDARIRGAAATVRSVRAVPERIRTVKRIIDLCSIDPCTVHTSKEKV